MVRDTSIEAFNRVLESGLLARRQLEVFEALFNFGPKTASELFQRVNFGKNRTQSNVTTRLGELRNMGVAREVRKRTCTVTGMTVIEWDVTAEIPQKRPKPTAKKCPHCKGSGKVLQENLF